MADLKHYTSSINDIFKVEKNRYKAHELAKPILLEMASDKNILFTNYNKLIVDFIGISLYLFSGKIIWIHF